MKYKLIIAILFVILTASLIYLAAPVSGQAVELQQGYGYGGYHGR